MKEAAHRIPKASAAGLAALLTACGDSDDKRDSLAPLGVPSAAAPTSCSLDLASRVSCR
jgi:hypothetical protein